MNLNSKTYSNGVVLGGILSASAFIIALAAQGLGMLDIVLYLAVTPIIIAVLKKGLGFGAIVSVVSSMLVFLMLGPFPAGTYFAVTVIPVGLTLGVLIKNKAKYSHTILTLSSVLFITISAGLWILSISTGISFVDDINTTAKASMKLFEQIMGPVPIDQSIIISKTLKLFYSTLPFVIACLSICYAFYLWLFNSWILVRLEIGNENFTMGAGIKELLEYPKVLSYILPILFILPSILKQLRMEIPISIGETSVNIISSVCYDLALIICFLFFAKGLFTIRDFLFLQVQSLSGRLFFIICLLTILSPFATLFGWYICFTGRIPQIRRSLSQNPEVSPDKISIELLKPSKEENRLPSKKSKKKSYKK